MGIKQLDISGSDQVGVHLARIGNVLFHPPGLTDNNLELIDESLGLERKEISIGGSALVGALILVIRMGWQLQTLQLTTT